MSVSFLGKRLKIFQKNVLEAVKHLQQENKRRDEFLAMLGHELRNPLAAISTASALLKFVRQDTERLEMTSDVITRQVNHMVRLIDDLLDISRLTRGLVIIDKEPLDLREMIQAALDQVNSIIEARVHQVDLHMPAKPASVCGDRVRLIQIIGNFINNAAKYTLLNG